MNELPTKYLKIIITISMISFILNNKNISNNEIENISTYYEIFSNLFNISNKNSYTNSYTKTNNSFICNTNYTNINITNTSNNIKESNESANLIDYNKYNQTYYDKLYNNYIKKNRNKNSSMFYKVLSTDPDIRLYYNFLIEGESEYLINKIKNRLERSSTFGGYTNTRTSSSAYFKKSEDKIIFNIEKRISKLVNTTLLKMEPLQIVNYKKNQYYYEHFDWGSQNGNDRY